MLNLCVDWHRKEFGWVVLLPAIAALSTFDQVVYRLYFEEALHCETCKRTFQDDLHW